MDEALVEPGTRPSTPEDTVWHLGDFAVRASAARVAALLARLHGAKHLIAGNNDDTGDHARLPGLGQRAGLRRDRGGGPAARPLPLSAALLEREGRGAINLHGHSHGRLAPLPRQFDVGVDARDFRPVTLQELLAERRRRASAALSDWYTNGPGS